MISPADDLLIHQTPELHRYVATSDRRFYDRHFMTGHSCSDELFFMLGIGSYPNLGVIDAFASVAVGDEQLTTRGSREIGVDRLDTTAIGPIGIEVLEGLRRLRVWCRPDHDQGVELELEWTAAVEMFQEDPHFSRVLGRVMQQATRLIQTGHWSGHITVGGRRYDVTPDTWWGGRDRAWGVRSLGLEREPPGIQQAHKVSSDRPPLWIWSPMQFEDHTLHFSLSEHASGKRGLETVHRIPRIGRGGELEVLDAPDHDLEFDPQTREFLGGSVSFAESDGRRTSVRLTPLRRAYLRAGTGYGGPDPWRHGKYMGATWSSTVTHDLGDTAVTAKIGPTHVVCRMETDTGLTGYGTFETQVYGTFPRYGFEA
ncbi:MAG: hypothetical protein JWP18_2334 [Solirubrobacterales bacterium]|jgi:hypothetical protein|nr:hypothetical protein [Solirubrobacterales bacterium]